MKTLLIKGNLYLQSLIKVNEGGGEMLILRIRGHTI